MSCFGALNNLAICSWLGTHKRVKVTLELLQGVSVHARQGAQEVLAQDHRDARRNA